ncbi:tetratricopeptide repeat protein [Novosphingobium umbonatum]|uniref:Tetratricopeptide repeat protein n=1 Tax=Novosphingobium umbonatum TaxID=1908524 RepID=A0A437N607_9SPHN|nr:tetratricopeptide repeat protein [Novosphingobium umbonatum]RVU05327.1 tetratricopeptide repeat protein [Novosphingobium umbonatum]
MALRPTPPQTREQQLAARQAEQGEAFLREVDDALREDQTLLALKRYAKPVGAGLVLGLAALGGWLYWGHYQDQQAAQRAEQLTIAMDQIEASQNANATKVLDTLAADKSGASAVVAQLLQAGLLVQSGKAADAAKRYEAIAKQADAPQPYRDFATLRQVALSFDTMKPDAVVAALKPLAAPGGAWFGQAGELLAIAYLKQGKNDLAGPLFGAIAKDKDQPDSLRARARQMAGVLGFDAVDDIAPPAEMAPQAPAAAQPAAAPAQPAKPE